MNQIKLVFVKCNGFNFYFKTELKTITTTPIPGLIEKSSSLFEKKSIIIERT